LINHHSKQAPEEMANKHRRYVFIDYKNLQTVKFKQLRKVCDRVFVFVNADEINVPMPLVLQMQRMGKGVKWIPIKNPLDGKMNFHICFLMGLLHDRVDKDIEFAIFSNDKHFDSLLEYVDSKGRNAIRVKRKKNKSNRKSAKPVSPISDEIVEEASSRVNTEEEEEQLALKPMPQTTGSKLTDHMSAHVIIEQTARQTVKRLIRSGNRPKELSSLKKYILLHNQEMTVQGNIDKIILHLQKTKEIQIKNNEVNYNF